MRPRRDSALTTPDPLLPPPNPKADVRSAYKIPIQDLGEVPKAEGADLIVHRPSPIVCALE
jgi:hypothetical protein